VGTAADIGAVEVGCGNGFIEHAEACDDGNTAIGDGCSDICEIEADTDGVDEDDEAGGGCSLID
jgi:cysteine-rich repeat protein